MTPIARARAALPEATVLSFAPGRINIIGEHTDYIGGLALAGATAAGVAVAVAPAPRGWQVAALDTGEVATAPGGYLGGAVAVVSEHLSERQRGPLSAFRAVVAGDVPQGAGLSSSAALCVALVRALLCWVGEPEPADTVVVDLAQAVEHRFAGVPCGRLDQTASQGCPAGGLLHIDFRAQRTTPVPWSLEGAGLMLLDTGVRRTLAGSGYAERVAEVQAGLESSGSPHWRALTEAQLSDAQTRGALTPRWAQRLRHGIRENQRVVAAVAAVEAGDAATLGRLLDESHESLAGDYAVSCAELDTLAALAREVPGVWGARMVGGGFGGCVLVLHDGVDDARWDAVLESYRRCHNRRGRRVEVALGAGAWVQTLA